MELPSKELLSEVLGNGVYVHVSLDNCVVSWNNACKDESIDIYELVHKCKEWLNIDIKISHYKDNEYRKGYVEVTLNYDSSSVFANKGFEADTEFEAVLKACEWVRGK